MLWNWKLAHAFLSDMLWTKVHLPCSNWKISKVKLCANTNIAINWYQMTWNWRDKTHVHVWAGSEFFFKWQWCCCLYYFIIMKRYGWYIHTFGQLKHHYNGRAWEKMDFDNTPVSKNDRFGFEARVFKKYTCLRSKLKILTMRFAYPLIKIPGTRLHAAILPLH